MGGELRPSGYRIFIPCIWTVALVGLLGGVPAQASLTVPLKLTVPLNLQRMSREAGAIFVGRALEARSGRDPHGLPATFTTFEVEPVLKGDLTPGARVSIKQYGYAEVRPAAGEIFQAFGPPRYRPGRRYFLLLYPPSGLGFQSPVGLAQSALRKLVLLRGDGVAR